MTSRIRQSLQRQADRLLTTGQRFKRFDELRQRHFWSTYLLQVDALETGNQYIRSGVYKTFLAVAGQQGQGWPVELTGQETNWKSAGRVPDNQNFEVLEIGVSFNKYSQNLFENLTTVENPPSLAIPNPRLANTIFMNTVVEIEYLTNRVPLGLCQDFAQAAGATMGAYNAAAVLPPGVPINATTGNLTDNDSNSFTTNGLPAPGLRRKFDIPILLQHGETFSFNFRIERDFFVSNDPQDPINGAFPLRLDFWATESFVEKS